MGQDKRFKIKHREKNRWENKICQIPVKQSEKFNIHVIRVLEGKDRKILAEAEVMVKNFPKVAEDFK